MLVAMSLMGATLMVVAAGDHKRNGNLNIKQQTFYAAETGITEAKKWLASETSLAPGSGPGNNLSFCKTSFFPELSNPKLIKDKIEKKDLKRFSGFFCIICFSLLLFLVTLSESSLRISSILFEKASVKVLQKEIFLGEISTL